MELYWGSGIVIESQSIPKLKAASELERLMVPRCGERLCYRFNENVTKDKAFLVLLPMDFDT